MGDDPTVLDPIIIGPPVANPGFAADHGLPADTVFNPYPGGSGYVSYGRPDSETYDGEVFDERLVGTGEEASNAPLEERLKKKEDEKKKEAPPPTGPNPHPPEFIVDDGKAIAISTAPDVCRVGSTPTPFMSYALGSDDENYSPNVFSNGFAIKHNQSRIWLTRGDEPGTGLGVKSNTVSSKVIPNSHSSRVKVNGIWVQRHADTCWLNSGNNPGEYTHVQSTDTHEAPDATDEQDKRAWYEKAYDWTGDKLSQANDAIWEFDRNNYSVVTRGLGGLQAVGGAAEAVAGAGLAGVGGAASTTGIGAAPGVPAMIGGAALAVNGYDNFQAGLRQLWSGESTPTMIAQASGEVASALGASPETAQTVENVVGITQGAAGGAGAVAATMRTGGKVATVTGVQGARSTSLPKPATGSYKDLKKTLKGTDEQANHLNQDAAFRDKIPTDEGAANAMRGNAFKDVGSPHYNFHQSLEGFWDQYRKGGALFGQAPTVAQYDTALRNALAAGGYGPGDVSYLADLAAANRGTYGLTGGDLVPRIPGRINQSK